jgi:uncharacterized RDD family membrane protein YckC
MNQSFPPPTPPSPPPPPPLYVGAHDLAGFWTRVGGSLIDGLISIVVIALVFTLLEAAGVDAIDWTPFKDDQGEVLLDFPVPRQPWAGLCSVAIAAAYAFLVHKRGATVGMSAVSIRCVTKEGRYRLSYPSACLRHVLPLLIGVASNFVGLVQFASLLVYLWMLWDDDNQTLNDKLAKAVVVNVR